MAAIAWIKLNTCMTNTKSALIYAWLYNIVTHTLNLTNGDVKMQFEMSTPGRKKNEI